MYGGLLSMNCRNRDHNRTENNCYYIPVGTYPSIIQEVTFNELHTTQ